MAIDSSQKGKKGKGKGKGKQFSCKGNGNVLKCTGCGKLCHTLGTCWAATVCYVEPSLVGNHAVATATVALTAGSTIQRDTVATRVVTTLQARDSAAIAVIAADAYAIACLCSVPADEQKVLRSRLLEVFTRTIVFTRADARPEVPAWCSG